MTPTIKDVAKQAGVSVSTASHALNDYSDISEETRRRVREAARRINYHANSAARALVSRKTGLIGLALFGEGLAHPFFHQVIEGAVSELDNSGHNAIISAVDASGDFYRSAFLRKMHERRLEGLLVMGISETHPAVDVLLESGVPTVFIDAPVNDERVAYVQSDNYQGTYLAAEHLLALGHRDITFVNEIQHTALFQERSRGFKDALTAWGIENPENRIIFATDMVEDGISAAQSSVSLGSTAIMTFSDRLALGVIEGIRTMGLKIPDDISVIGFDDIALAEYASPPLTTVRQHGREMGRLAAQELVNASNQPVSDPYILRRHIVDTKLIVRSSTGPAADKMI